MTSKNGMDDGHRALFQSLSSKYELQGVIGQGAMGTVYLAHDRKHDRRVAIKTIQPDFVAEAGRPRFEQEIKVTARLQHPHILPLLDSGVIDDVLYYVMPFVEGESLRQRLDRDKQLPVDEALRIAREVADALSNAHALDIIHRDIKPSNIMLSGGHAYVMDFGIARAVSDTSRGVLTGTGMAMGTPLYMSPEQALDASAADGRSDVYSLGCVLFEMLAGQPPFSGATLEAIVHQHLAVPAPAITNFRPAVPAEVVSILARALAKSPADRFSPAAQFGEALGQSALRGAQQVVGWKARNTILVAVIYLIAALGLFRIVERVAEGMALPTWLVPLSLVLLLIGLPVVLVTAVVQSGGSRRGAAPPTPTLAGAAATGVFGGAVPESERRILALFTWGNVIAGGVLAMALWGVVATSWLIWFQDASPVEASSRTETSAAERVAADEPSDATDPGRRDSEASVEVAPAPSPPAAPPAAPPSASGSRGPDADQGSFRAARVSALAARESAEAAGVRSVQAGLAAAADSLWEAAAAAASAGSYTAALSLVERAGEDYDQARLAAVATWRQRLGAAREAVAVLRQEADPAAPAYGNGERLLEASAGAARDGDYERAVTSLEAAGEAYRLAVRTEPRSADPEPVAPPPSPQERVAGVLAQLKAAMEGEDIGRLRAVWVGLTPGEVAGFQSSFDAWEDIRVTLEPLYGTMTVSGDRISVVIAQRWDYRGGQLRSPPQRFEIAERDGRWVITSVGPG